MEKIKVTATEGLQIIYEVITCNYLAEASGITRTILSCAVRCGKRNGKRYYLSETEVEKLNAALPKIILFLRSTNICLLDGFEVLQSIMPKVKVKRIFMNQFHVTDRWYRMHMTDRSEWRYYGKFDTRTMLDFQLYLRSFAGKLESIEMVCDRPADF